jgi:predicted site-specific integrase-resolvase
MSTKFLVQSELAQRWRVSPRTLERWRWLGQEPRFLRLGGRVVYRIEDVEAFELKQIRGPAADASSDLGTFAQMRR